MFTKFRALESYEGIIANQDNTDVRGGETSYTTGMCLEDDLIPYRTGRSTEFLSC